MNRNSRKTKLNFSVAYYYTSGGNNKRQGKNFKRHIQAAYL